jgi:hypothetical protein
MKGKQMNDSAANLNQKETQTELTTYLTGLMDVFEEHFTEDDRLISQLSSSEKVL